MKQATLKYDDEKGFILIDSETKAFIDYADAGELDSADPSEIDWDSVREQCYLLGYALVD